MTYDHETIRLEIEPPLAEIVLTREQVHNAISSAMTREILAALHVVEESRSARILIVRGEGANFCAGADLAELKTLQQSDYEGNLQAGRELAALFGRLYSFPKATVAAVQGACVAGGCGLATACDLVVADPGAHFRYSEVSIGFVAAIVSIFLVRAVGEKHARELMLTARRVQAEEAERIGLVNEVTAEGEYLERARTIAREIALNSPAAIRHAKEVLTAVQVMGLEEALKFTAEYNARARLEPECLEGVRAFFEKRAPAWRADVEEMLAGESND